MLINKNISSQPQYENCTHVIRVPLIEYQTLSVDTKNLRLISRLQASLNWIDPELAWNTSIYDYEEVILPVDKIWTPEIHVTNGILTTMKHSSVDLLVFSNGTVKHSVIINAEVNCEVNLFNYPFASDECPVAIQAWSVDGCGTILKLGHLRNADSTQGDWQTNYVVLQKKRDDRNYIMVSLSIKYLNPFITLLLPSILIVLADVVSFALPLGCGERNSFKVTLVLSFTLFLGILNDRLPGDGQCSPIIRTHFCVCLVLLVLSMLVSMILTRVAKDGGFIFCCCPKRSGPKNKVNKDDEEDDDSIYPNPTSILPEAKADISVIQLSGSEESNKMLGLVVNFLQAWEAKAEESERYEALANKLDQTFFWFYLFLGGTYFVAMTAVMIKYPCTVNHFDFWD
ncbi:5-hydroxytryptamine receptor 3A-like [Limanda limanda]|uniref:5-hydroxytryptamine receptor 3A-like n=1 Tax=Limanda limanda TaxID=27771 RepID=UPI0029C6E7CF|nr:5-hydroxytryptamine receptor 3A-like [Limanda limanda]